MGTLSGQVSRAVALWFLLQKRAAGRNRRLFGVGGGGVGIGDGRGNSQLGGTIPSSPHQGPTELLSVTQETSQEDFSINMTMNYKIAHDRVWTEENICLRKLSEFYETQEFWLRDCGSFSSIWALLATCPVAHSGSLATPLACCHRQSTPGNAGNSQPWPWSSKAAQFQYLTARMVFPDLQIQLPKILGEISERDWTPGKYFRRWIFLFCSLLDISSNMSSLCTRT